jgi:hypothetical protein
MFNAQFSISNAQVRRVEDGNSRRMAPHTVRNSNLAILTGTQRFVGTAVETISRVNAFWKLSLEFCLLASSILPNARHQPDFLRLPP